MIICAVLAKFNMDCNIFIEFKEYRTNSDNIEPLFKGTTTMRLLSSNKNNFIPITAFKKKQNILAYAKEGFSQQMIAYLDYLSDGIQYVPIFAIDYSLSNLTFDNNRSLHHLNPNKSNIYLNVLETVAKMYEGWSDSFLAYGFGAKIVPRKSETSNCFALSKNYFLTLIKGTDHLAKVKKSGSNVAFSF